jgi:hypothetical protein
VSPDVDEYGAWLVWGLRDAAFRYKTWTDAGELDRFFAQAAGELEAAQRAGTLPRRFTPVAFVAPEWSGLFTQLPLSARASWAIVTDPASKFNVSSFNLPPYERAIYDRVALRRTGLDQPDASEPAQAARRNVLWHSEGVRQSLDHIRITWTNAHRHVLAWCWWLPLLVLSGWTWHAFRTRRVPLVAVLLAALVATALARFALVCLLDASGVWTQTRYLLAFAMLSDLAILIAFASTVRETIDWIRR